jgi:hypothetical protein
MQTLERNHTGKAIKQELKKVFPETKFSVRYESFSGGDSVDVDWNFGPTDEEVTKIISKYQMGHFNGMIDLYEYTNDRNDIPQAKYVMAQRSYDLNDYLAIPEKDWKARATYHNEGKGFWNRILKEVCEFNGVEVSQNSRICEEWASTLVHRILNKIDFRKLNPENCHLKRVEGVTCGKFEDFYTITE